jgi:hypothetical protein
MSDQSTAISGAEGYFDAETCLEILFPDGGISPRFFRKLQAQGYIPYLKLGRRTLFNPSEVKAALEKRCKRRSTVECFAIWRNDLANGAVSFVTIV